MPPWDKARVLATGIGIGLAFWAATTLWQDHQAVARHEALLNEVVRWVQSQPQKPPAPAPSAMEAK